MAAPNLQAEGAIAAVTTGSVSPTIPTHAADDILWATVLAWLPSTASDVAAIPTPTGWTQAAQIATPASPIDGRIGWFWRRAAAAGETVSFTRGASWDTGTDGVYAARVDVIRGCITTGNPWDDLQTSGPFNTANQSCPALTAAGSERLAMQFIAMQDNATTNSPAAGWTGGTRSASATGTDAATDNWRKDNNGANTSAAASQVSAPAQGYYAIAGVMFKPPTPSNVTGSGTATATLSPTASGTATLKVIGSGSPVATLSPTASGTATLRFVGSGAAIATLSPTASGTATLKVVGSGTAIATLSPTASGTATLKVIGSGTAIATLSPTASGTASLRVIGSGVAIATLSAFASGSATAAPGGGEPTPVTGSGTAIATLSPYSTGTAALRVIGSGAVIATLSAYATTPEEEEPPAPRRARGGFRVLYGEEEPEQEKPKTRVERIVEAAELPNVDELQAYTPEPLGSIPRLRAPARIRRAAPEPPLDEDERDFEDLVQILALIE